MSYSKYFLLFFAFLFLVGFVFSMFIPHSPDSSNLHSPDYSNSPLHDSSTPHLPDGCTCNLDQNTIKCDVINTTNDWNLDAFSLSCQHYTNLDITVYSKNIRDHNFNFVSQDKNNIDIYIESNNNYVNVNFDFKKKLNIKSITLLGNKKAVLRDIDRNVILQDLVLYGIANQDINVYIYGFNSIKNIFPDAETINLFLFDKYFLNNLEYAYYPDITLNIDSNKKPLDINNLVLDGTLRDKDNIILKKGIIGYDYPVKNLDLNLTPKSYDPRSPFIDLNNVKNSNITINYDPNVSYDNVSYDKNFYNLVKMNNCLDVNIIGNVDFNKLESLAQGPKTMFDVNYSTNINFTGFKFYSEKQDYIDNNLNYFNVANSRNIMVHNNVFNNANYVFDSNNSVLSIYTNSFYSNNAIFNDIGNTVEFFNNFVLDNNLYVPRDSTHPDIDLQMGRNTDKNKSYAYNTESNNCKIKNVSDWLLYGYELKGYGVNIPMYYYSKKENTFVKKSFLPECLGGNLYGEKTIPEFCGNDCFDPKDDYDNDNGVPDFVNDTPYQVQDLNDYAPLIDYHNLIFAGNDLFTMMVQFPEGDLNSTQKIDFNLIIQPKSYEKNYFNDVNLIFNKLDVNLNNTSVTIPIGKNPKKLPCNSSGPLNLCVLFPSVYEQMIIKDINFDLSQFNILTSGNYNITFTLDYNVIPSNLFCYTMSNLSCNYNQKVSTKPYPIKIKGSLKTVKTPDNNLFVVFGLIIVVIGMYLYRFRK